MEKQNGCEFAVKMLRLNDSLLMGKNDLSANESAIVTEDMTWEEFESKNQELLRQRYKDNIGFRVFEKECPHLPAFHKDVFQKLYEIQLIRAWQGQKRYRDSQKCLSRYLFIYGDIFK